MTGDNSKSSSSGESSSRMSNQEKENSIKSPAPNTVNNPADMTEVKQMLGTLFKKAVEQQKFNEATTKELKALSRRKRKRHEATRLRGRFSTPRTARRDSGDLPPPPPRRDTDGTPERAVEVSDDDQPPPRRRARTNTAGDSARADGEGEPSTAELYQREQERRSPRGSRDEEVAALQAQLDKVVSDLKATQLQMYRSTAKAPGIAYVLERARSTPFAERVARVQISDPGKVKLPIYEGTTDPAVHLMEFEVALGRANFTEAEKDIGYCKLFVESLKGPALQ